MMPQADPGFEVADAQLDDGVAAVVGVQPDRGADSVGDEGARAGADRQAVLGLT
jgi:hypothetical protein